MCGIILQNGGYMKKYIKSGFTLAEVLVTLGIVGVITSLMMPTFISGVQKKQLAASLGKNVESVQIGCQKLIQYANEQSTDTIFEGHYSIHKNLNGSPAYSDTHSISGNNLWTNTSSFFNTKTIASADITRYKGLVKSFGRTTASPTVDSLAGSNIILNEKTGAYWGTKSVTEANTIYNSKDPVVGYIYIDVNGEKSPNIYGRDIFLYGLTDACAMIPAGSERMKQINSNIPTDNSACNGTSITNGLSCTSRVAREGYKINY